MNTLRDRERDVSDYRQQRTDYRDQNRDQDREISLGTGTILGIFFTLALLCAIFFGFGYSMGRKSAQPAIAATPANSATGLLGGTKPSPGSPLGAPSSARLQTAANNTPAAPEADESQFQSSASPSSIPEHVSGTSNRPSIVVRAPVPASAAATGQDFPAATASKPAPRTVSAAPLVQAPNPAAPSPMPAISPNGTIIVQVAAVSHQEDADLLLSALKNRGYAVFIRQEPQDRLLHVQVGPFAARKDADAMRQRLLSDGYNAIVK